MASCSVLFYLKGVFWRGSRQKALIRVYVCTFEKGTCLPTK